MPLFLHLHSEHALDKGCVGVNLYPIAHFVLNGWTDGWVDIKGRYLGPPDLKTGKTANTSVARQGFKRGLFGEPTAGLAAARGNKDVT